VRKLVAWTCQLSVSRLTPGERPRTFGLIKAYRRSDHQFSAPTRWDAMSAPPWASRPSSPTPRPSL